MADHLVRLLVIPDAVLLLMEKSEACRDVTGHQVRVLDGESQGPIIKPRGKCPRFLKISFIQFTHMRARVHTHTHSYVICKKVL